MTWSFSVVFSAKCSPIVVIAVDSHTMTFKGINPAAKVQGRSNVNMSPSQLSRKRTNDRLAQRALRARRKAHEESLEAEVRDLRMKLTEHDTGAFQNLVARNLALEFELTRLRKQILPDFSSNTLAFDMHETTIPPTVSAYFQLCNDQRTGISTPALMEEAYNNIPTAPTTTVFPPLTPLLACSRTTEGLGTLLEGLNCSSCLLSGQHNRWDSIWSGNTLLFE